MCTFFTFREMMFSSMVTDLEASSSLRSVFTLYPTRLHHLLLDFFYYAARDVQSIDVVYNSLIRWDQFLLTTRYLVNVCLRYGILLAHYWSSCILSSPFHRCHFLNLTASVPFGGRFTMTWILSLLCYGCCQREATEVTTGMSIHNLTIVDLLVEGACQNINIFNLRRSDWESTGSFCHC